jgi:hypothetical protein
MADDELMKDDVQVEPLEDAELDSVAGGHDITTVQSCMCCCGCGSISDQQA